MNVLGIIPARGGSRGIPKKNIRSFLGKPLLAWTIEEMAKVSAIDRCIVSTDSQEIAEIAGKYNCPVPFLRPPNISTDRSLDIEFIEHAINWLKINDGYCPDVIIRLPPTSPLRSAKHVEEGLAKFLLEPSLDSLKPITLAPKHPYKMWTISDGTIVPFLSDAFTGIKEAYNSPRQLFPDAYVQTGAFDIMHYKTIIHYKSISGKKIGYYLMRPEDSINIDNEFDFLVAEYFMQKKLS